MGRECKMSEAVSSVRIPAGSAVEKTLTVGIPRACALDSMVDEIEALYYESCGFGWAF